MTRARALAVVLACGPSLASATCPTLPAFAERGGLPTLNGQAPRCARSQVLGGGLSEDCFWSFELRSETARSHFAVLLAELKDCSAEPPTIAASSVNHPDSFDQVTGVIAGTAVSLSLKDKGALGQTLIFVRRALPQ
ncbi:MAG: hypothetical protein AAF092_12555 [Pseudomonadota bacterium]